MTITHLHLLLNHFPVIGTLIGTLLLVYAVGIKNYNLQKASLAVIFSMALIAIPVFLTGEPAEETVEKIQGVSKNAIEDHEEASQIAFWAMQVTGVLAGLSMIFLVFQFKLTRMFVNLSLVAGIITSVLMVRTGYLGGQIRHTEIAVSAISTPVNEQNGEIDND